MHFNAMLWFLKLSNFFKSYHRSAYRLLFSDHFLQLLLHTIHHPFFCLSPAALEFWKQINFETMNSLGSLWGCNMSQVWVLSWGVWQRTWRGKKYNFIKNYKVYNEKKWKNPKKPKKAQWNLIKPKKNTGLGFIKNKWVFSHPDIDRSRQSCFAYQYWILMIQELHFEI